MTRDEWIKLILGSGLVFGIILRLAPGLMAGFPLNDGGMFLSMIRDLRTSHYLLPVTTSYNLADIPYAYPPLGFYIARLLADVFRIPELSLLRWLPVTFNILTILAFFLLADSIFGDKARAALAAAFLAVSPGGYLWHIMGGGLTRSLGAVFLLLSVYFLTRLFKTGQWRYFVLALLACSLAVLSHPEIALHTAGSCALFWLFYGRTRRGTVQVGLIGLGTLLLTSPWWFSVMQRFGLAPFLSTLHTGMYGSSFLKSLAAIVFARLSIVPFLLVLRLMGIAWSAWKRNYILLIVWVVLPVLVEPRSSGAISFYPLSMLAAIGFADALPALVNWFRARKSLPLVTDFTQNRVMNLTVVSILLFLFMESFASGYALVNTSLKPPVLDAMSWVQQNTPTDSQFIILTGGGIMTDPVQEWFPALAKRHSQTTLQGFEWTLGSKFFPRYNQLVALQECETLACVEAWSVDTKTAFTHLFLETGKLPDGLLLSLQRSDRYLQIYNENGIAVYEAANNVALTQR